jgi:glycosyltransferase involved in cell wall biosynthesis
VKILLIGNIANNAYLLGKYINRYTDNECDVLCYDYYHIMGCPEWEDSIIDRQVEENMPEWHSLDLGDFQRPEWFVSGPLFLCVKYLSAKNNGHEIRLKMYKRLLSVSNKTQSATFLDKVFIRYYGFLSKLSKMSFGRLIQIAAKFIRLKSFKKLVERMPLSLKVSAGVYKAIKHETGIEYSQELAVYDSNYRVIKKILSEYDIVQGFATDGMYPMFAGSSYAAFEHGTIRQLPFLHSLSGILCSLTYKNAFHSFITNADNLQSAKKMGLQSYSFLPHPVNEEFIDDNEANALIGDLKERYDTDFIVFHSSRHHWNEQREADWEKGNDILIRGFAAFLKNNPRAKLICVEWGKHVKDSKQLISNLGIDSNVEWMPPVCHRIMCAYIKQSDIFADQFFLGSFGSSMPKALMLGTPCMMYLEEQYHEGCFSDMPPVVNVRSEEDVAHELGRYYLDSNLLGNLSIKGKEWYINNHSIKQVIKKVIPVYEINTKK